MRTVKMQGGLGNQLVCLGFADHLARATGEPVALDIASFATGHYGHRFELEALSQALGLRLVRRPLASSRLAAAAMDRATNPWFVTDRTLSPKADPRRLEQGRYFAGYWQDEGWLAPGFREQVRADLLSRAAPTASHGLVVHYRTYKEEIRPDRRATPDGSWFARSFARLGEAGLDTSDAVLISDDPALALERMGASGLGVQPATGGTMWSDLALMLRAKALILSNSTFSWWGGYAGEADTILYPAKGNLFHYAPAARAFTIVE